jgi:hypothetical protein
MRWILFGTFEDLDGTVGLNYTETNNPLWLCAWRCGDDSIRPTRYGQDFHAVQLNNEAALSACGSFGSIFLDDVWDLEFDATSLDR